MVSRRFGDNQIVDGVRKADPQVHPTSRQPRHYQSGGELTERVQHNPAAMMECPADIHEMARPTG
jgi:hypothetical protein